VDVGTGLDVGKETHFAGVLDNDGERLFARAVANDQGGLEALLDRAARHGPPGLVIDQPGSIAQFALAVAARRGVPVAYVPGLVMRRAADLYPGEAKTDRRDAYVLAGTGRTSPSASTASGPSSRSAPTPTAGDFPLSRLDKNMGTPPH
jgi:transposase